VYRAAAGVTCADWSLCGVAWISGTSMAYPDLRASGGMGPFQFGSLPRIVMNHAPPISRLADADKLTDRRGRSHRLVLSRCRRVRVL